MMINTSRFLQPISLVTISSPDLLNVAIAVLLLLFEMLCVRLLGLAGKLLPFFLDFCVSGATLCTVIYCLFTHNAF